MLGKKCLVQAQNQCSYFEGAEMFPRDFVMDLLQLIENMRCPFCREQNIPDEWPTKGAYTAFYFQRDKEDGNYFVTMNCPKCNKTWYVAWDDYPGEFIQIRDDEKRILRKKQLGML